MEYLGFSSTQLEQANALWTAKEISQQPDCWQQTLALIEAHRIEIDQF